MKKQDLTTEIKKIIGYIDSTIEARNATEPNALALRGMLAKLINYPQ